MAQTNLTIRIDEDLKKQLDEFCTKVGINITTAFNLFARKVVSEQRIPFEISTDPFYSEKNINHSKSVIDDPESSRTVV